MALSTINSDLTVLGQLFATTMTLPPSAVGDSQVSSTAAIQVTKVQHLKVAGTDFGIAADAAPSATVKKVIFVASGACTIRQFKAVERDSGSASSNTYDLQKATAGSATLATCLSSVITITNATTDNTPVAGTLTTTTLAAGDMLVAVLTFGSATGVLGPFAWCEIDTAAN